MQKIETYREIVALNRPRRMPWMNMDGKWVYFLVEVPMARMVVDLHDRVTPDTRRILMQLPPAQLVSMCYRITHNL